MPFKKKTSILSGSEESTVKTVDTQEEVTIKKSTLDAILDRVNRLENKETSPSVTSQQKMYRGPRIYSYRTMDGKPITHFELTKNQVKVELRTGGWDEDQRCKLTYADGTTEDMMYGDYAQGYKLSDQVVPLEVLNQGLITYKDQDREPEVMDMSKIKEKYYIFVEGSKYPVLDHDMVSKLEVVNSYTFQIPGVNDGNPFIVDQTAIN